MTFPTLGPTPPAMNPLFDTFKGPDKKPWGFLVQTGVANKNILNS